jgi:hypothetical protein
MVYITLIIFREHAHSAADTTHVLVPLVNARQPHSNFAGGSSVATAGVDDATAAQAATGSEDIKLACHGDPTPELDGQ